MIIIIIIIIIIYCLLLAMIDNSTLQFAWTVMGQQGNT